MASAPFRGGALLIAGYRPTGGRDDRVAPVLGQIGETLRAAPTPWLIHRLSPVASGRWAPSQANLKLHLDELIGRELDAMLIVIAGEIAGAADRPALITGGHAGAYLDDASLPLGWIRGCLTGSRRTRTALVISACAAAPGATGWLDALHTGRADHAIAVDHADGRDSLLAALLAGLTGDALDPGTGTVTMRSLSAHLARAVPTAAMQASSAAETLATIPPLGGPWGATASRRLRAVEAEPVEPGDLTGVVLPGQFRIDRALASGTFGTVYRARQLAVDRDVAVKVLHADIDPASDDGRLFVHEIQSVGRIDHANVVRIYQADVTADGRLFFAMELLDGRDLQRVIEDDGRLEPARALALIGQLLAGLAAAHDAGLVHADVKPGNAFVVGSAPRERVVLIDFGLSRLRPTNQPAESVGGTPIYMAPEQLRDGRVDHRSDLFAAALVLVKLLTGWQRGDADALQPPLDAVADPRLRAVLARATALDPAARFASATDFAHALAGEPTGPDATPIERSPFRHLAPFTELDAGRLRGRDRDLAALTEQLALRPVVVYAAPSGTGKTSLLRAGLVPRLTALHTHAIYQVCRPGWRAALVAAIDPAATDVADAIARWHRRDGGPLVVILDQVEMLLTDEPGGAPASEGAGVALLAEVLGAERGPVAPNVTVVLSVRDDFLGRLLAADPRLARGVAMERLRPLGRDGARAAIVEPLAERRIVIAAELLEILLDDLTAAGAALGPEMGWGAGPAVYPPHLQLACAVLYAALEPSAAVLTLDHYRRLGGFDAIVGEYLDRVLDSELDAGAARIARDLFVALVTAAHTRAFRTEAELIELVAGHDEAAVRTVLAALSSRGLLVRVRARDGEAGWELVHDSLVPRVEAWISSRDVARRRAIEMLRHHLRRSEGDRPSLLSRRELRELRKYPDAVRELDAAWRKRDAAWPPARLITRSQLVARRRIATLAALAAAAVAAAAIVIATWLAERDRRLRDLGRFTFELAVFDPDPAGAVSIQALPDLRWELRDPDPGDRTSPDHRRPPFASGRVAAGAARTPTIEARGGPAFLVVSGRHRRGDAPCPPSIVPLQQLPGYVERDRPPVIAIRVPTCAATRADTIEIPSGEFMERVLVLTSGGDGEYQEQKLDLARFWIDRTEVTNAAFSVFAAMADVTGVQAADYIDSPELKGAALPDLPVANVDWVDARAYCRFLGKGLPTPAQWGKAMRGGLTLPGNRRNPEIQRTLPWGSIDPTRANIHPGKDALEKPRPAPVGSFPGDVSPYDVMDLAGNVSEWTAASPPSSPGEPPKARQRLVRGGSWAETTAADLVEYVKIYNPRPMGPRFDIGLRCVLDE